MVLSRVDTVPAGESNGVSGVTTAVGTTAGREGDLTEVALGIAIVDLAIKSVVNVV